MVLEQSGSANDGERTAADARYCVWVFLGVPTEDPIARWGQIRVVTRSSVPEAQVASGAFLFSAASQIGKIERGFSL
ncbi:hypothetical protein EFM26_05110 [Limosilactobacillus fermentum]|uniref:Uncharacterized protein n=1 Tax=Limosilactobacillus fermentum TaxID=1613 RepID=A0A2K2TLD3_LIMFE|nr:hypothetical protein HMPREF0511_1516 [Limosilactobacillus fermentum ATCC 14931]MCS8619524.1 hypothetical protein [Limosilactobacillus fermentum]CDI68522.1 Putative uncharacterized protein [Limosilactobacillus fermentum L930BB]MCT2870268.1 hypothetical protein [Limosilactobacillus fermentum]MCT2917949.1 hypothetical protein [Limosilactobacillus fermentum]